MRSWFLFLILGSMTVLLGCERGAPEPKADGHDHAKHDHAQHLAAEAAKAEKSGVNLDEEAADLVRFQQAYQAAAQVISVANSLFDSLLGAVRR